MTDTGQIRRPGNPYGPCAGSMAVFVAPPASLRGVQALLAACGDAGAVSDHLLAVAAAEHLRRPEAALDARISEALRRARPWPLHQGQWASGARKCYVGSAVTGPDPKRNAGSGSGSRRHKQHRDSHRRSRQPLLAAARSRPPARGR